MSFYAGIGSMATRLLGKYGQTVTLTRTADGTYDTTDGTLTAGAQTEYECSAAVFDYAQQEIDGTQIRQGDRRVMLQATGDVPLPRSGDTLTIGSLDYTVVAVRTTSPGGTAVVYQLQVRGVQS